MGEIIKVEHLQYTYPGVDDTPGDRVFEDMNLTVEEGTFVAVLGSNRSCGCSCYKCVQQKERPCC